MTQLHDAPCALQRSYINPSLYFQRFQSILLVHCFRFCGAFGCGEFRRNSLIISAVQWTILGVYTTRMLARTGVFWKTSNPTSVLPSSMPGVSGMVALASANNSVNDPCPCIILERSVASTRATRVLQLPAQLHAEKSSHLHFSRLAARL